MLAILCKIKLSSTFIFKLPTHKYNDDYYITAKYNIPQNLGLFINIELRLHHSLTYNSLAHIFKAE